MSQPAIPTLIELLQSKDEGVAEDAMMALPGTGTNAIPPLEELLHDPNELIRVRAAIALADFGSQGRAAIPVLLRCLDNFSFKNRSVYFLMQIHAIRALGKIKEAPDVVVPAIIHRMQNENNWMIFNSCLTTLQKFGTNAAMAIPFLNGLLEPNSKKPVILLFSARIITNTLDLIRIPIQPVKQRQSSSSVQTNSPSP